MAGILVAGVFAGQAAVLERAWPAVLLLRMDLRSDRVD